MHLAFNQHACPRVAAQPWARCVCNAAIVFLLLGLGTRVRAAERSIAFYDPDANHQDLASITLLFNQFLATLDRDIKFRPVQSQETFEDMVKNEQTQFAIVTSELIEERTKFALEPLLVPAVRGDVHYRKVLLENMQAVAVAKRRTIAVTLVADDVQAATTTALSGLPGVPLDLQRARALRVSKDIDALLALAFRRVDAALVTPGTLEILRRVNPAAVTSMHVVASTRKILRAPFCAIKGRATPSQLTALVTALRNMQADDNGRQIMLTMAFDQWLPFEPRMLNRD